MAYRRRVRRVARRPTKRYGGAKSINRRSRRVRRVRRANKKSNYNRRHNYKFISESLYSPIFTGATQNNQIQEVFQLSQFTDAASIAARYSYYRINKIVVEYRPNCNVDAPTTNGGTGAVNQWTYIYTAGFHRAATSITTLNEQGILQLPNSKKHLCTRPFKRAYNPAIQVFTQVTGAATGGPSEIKFKPMLDSDFQTIPHYCGLTLFDTNNPAVTQTSITYDKIVTAYVTFKDFKGTQFNF